MEGSSNLSDDRKGDLSYADLEIRIFPNQGDAYAVEMTLDNGQEYGPGALSADVLPWTPGDDPAADGKRLFEALFADGALRAAWGEIRGRRQQRRIRLRIDAEAPELHALPWELLRDPDGPTEQDLSASSATPFSRYLAGRWQPGHPIFQRPLRILAVLSDPSGLDQYDLQAIEVETEKKILLDAVDGLEAEITFLPSPCTLGSIEKALRDGFHVLHFVGHGVFSQAAGKAALLLADDEGEVVRVSDEDLADLLARQLADVDARRDDKLRLVFLAACNSAERSTADAFRGLAPRLIAAGVPAVLAMQDRVAVDTAREFAGTFYRRLLLHGHADLAANEARSAVKTAQLPGSAIPVFFQRLRGDALLGRRGRITQDAETFWPFLVSKIDEGRCIPFLGPGVHKGLIAGRAQAARRLAEKYGFPFVDDRDWPRVAQFMALKDPDLLRREYLKILQRSLFPHLGYKPTTEDKRRFKDMGLSETISALEWSRRVHDVRETEVHHLLAELELPLYVTTNFDNFMSEALRTRPNVEPRREAPRRASREGSPQFVLDPSPSPERPVVFHLTGRDDAADDRETELVLCEDDFFEHLLLLGSRQTRVLPMDVIEALSTHSFLFLGYRLDDWEWRVLLHGLLKPIERSGKRVNVGVQLEPEDASDAQGAVRYLETHLARFDIEIYWGSTQQFVAELHERWSDVEEDW